jgi:hypothetical protein
MRKRKSRNKRWLSKRVRNTLAILAFLLGSIAAVTAFLNEAEVWCGIFEGLSWCQEPPPQPVIKPPEPPPEPPSVIELATELLTGQNPANLQIEIRPSATLKVGDAMKMRLHSDHDGYLIVLDINREGVLTTLFPNKYSDQYQRGYLKVGQSLTIPDAYYGFDFEVQKQTQGILVAILVEGDLTVVREVLPVSFEEMEESYARGMVQQLRQQLDKTVQNENGVEESIRWSGVKSTYEITDVP